MDNKKLRAKVAAIQAAIVLLPSFAAAWLTGDIVWVVPTVVAATLVANAVGTRDPSRIVEETSIEDEPSTQTDF